MTKNLSLPFVRVVPSSSSMTYTDDVLSIKGAKRADKLDDLFEQLDSLVTDSSSIMLYKQDVRDLAVQLSGKSHSSKDMFHLIKQHIRSRYFVLKLTLDPRTLQFHGLKTAFIIHKVF